MTTFTPELATNVAAINDRHRELINRINTVTSMCSKSFSKEETANTIEFLGAYIIYHFRDEEVLQRKSGYPKHEKHLELNEYYISAFRKLNKEFEQNAPSIQYSF